MTLLQALILGIVQGLTEFFPISSSSHLQLARTFLGIDHPSVLFDLTCHLGTLAALLVFFRRDLLSLWRFQRRQLLVLCAALLPLVPAYFLLKPLREMTKQMNLIGYFLLLSALFLLLSERLRLKFKPGRPFSEALLIGSFQALALIPGISRSASTISAARFIGWQLPEAVRFSFLLSIPTILGGSCLESLHALHQGEAFVPLPALIGGLAAFIVGYGALHFALRWLEKGYLRPFAYYCALLGIILVSFLD